LIAMDVDRCIGVVYFTGTAGSSTLTVDQIVGGIPMRGLAPSGNVTPVAGGVSPAVRGTAPQSAPAARPSGMSSGGTRSSY